MPAGYDAEVAELFRDLRAATALSEMDLAARLGTRADVVQALEQGALYALPPWAETCRVVNAYGALLNLDVRPLLRRIYAQLEAGIVELQPKPMPDVPMMTPPAEPQDYSFTPSNSGAASAPNPLDIPWPPPASGPPPQRNAWPNGPAAPSPQPQAPWQNAQPQPQPAACAAESAASATPAASLARRPAGASGSAAEPAAAAASPTTGAAARPASAAAAARRRNRRLRSHKRKPGRNRRRHGRRPAGAASARCRFRGAELRSSRRPSRRSRDRRRPALLKWGLGALVISIVAFGLWMALTHAPDARQAVTGSAGNSGAIDPDDPRSRKADRLPEPSGRLATIPI